MAILRTEKFLTERNGSAGECVDQRGRARDHSCVATVFVEFLDQHEVCLFNLVDTRFEVLVADLKCFDFLALSFPGRLCGPAVSEHTLNATLFLFIFRFGPFPRRKVGLGFGEDLTPRFALLRRLLLCAGR